MDGRLYRAHILAWLYITGSFPILDIDHINRDRDDNRFSNLREVSRSVNLHNSKRRCNNTSGHKGVSYDKTKSKWHAYIHKDGKRTNIGFFESKDDAVAARLDVERSLNYAEL